MLHNENLIGDEKNPLAGWTKDPYDENVKTGALMNVSEQEQFDEKFPGFPLSMCREFIKCVTEEN